MNLGARLVYSAMRWLFGMTIGYEGKDIVRFGFVSQRANEANT